MSINRVAVTTVVAGLAFAASADVITSDFNASDEGWLLADGNSPANETATVSPEYMPSNGNGEGFITTPVTWQQTAFFVAPGEFLGDQSGFFDGSVDVDRKFVGPDSWADTMQVDYRVDMTMTGLDGSVTLAVDLMPVSLTDWESFSVNLNTDGGWFHLVTGEPATAGEIAGVLGDLEDIRVRGNVRDSFGRIGVDNFRLVPTPSSAALLGLAGIACLRRRR